MNLHLVTFYSVYQFIPFIYKHYKFEGTRVKYIAQTWFAGYDDQK